MSKILVPQELQEQIVLLYKSGKTRKEIRCELALSFGDSVVKRILLENNCEIRSNPGAQVGGRKKDQVSKEDVEKIINLYNQGYGLNAISQRMGKLFCFDKVRRVLKDNGVKLRTFQESVLVKKTKDLRKYSINDDYNFESHNGAWLLGFLAADGYLPCTKGAKSRVILSLARKDEEILFRIKEELQFTGPIFQYTNSGFPASSLAFNSKTLRAKIESYGIVNNKTFKLKELPKNLPDEYMIDYIRGYFDGDGSIMGGEGKKICMSIVSANAEFLQEISTYLVTKYPQVITERTITKNHSIYQIAYSKNMSLFLGELFYNHSYLALERKRQHYFIIKREQLPRG